MTKEIHRDKKLADYYKQIKKGLVGSGKEKREIMRHLKLDIGDYIEENPDYQFEDILDHFGTPQSFTAEYLSHMGNREITEQVTKAKKIRKWIILAIAAVIVIAAVGTTIMVLENNSHVVEYYDVSFTTS